MIKKIKKLFLYIFFLFFFIILFVVSLYSLLVYKPDNGIKFIDKVSNGFIYMVSSFSITGAVNSFGFEQKNYFKRINKMNLKSKLLIGFGISNSSTFKDAIENSNGAIIGSAFINFLKENKIKDIGKFVQLIRG